MFFDPARRDLFKNVILWMLTRHHTYNTPMPKSIIDTKNRPASFVILFAFYKIYLKQTQFSLNCNCICWNPCSLEVSKLDCIQFDYIVISVRGNMIDRKLHIIYKPRARNGHRSPNFNVAAWRWAAGDSRARARTPKSGAQNSKIHNSIITMRYSKFISRYRVNSPN